MMIALRSEFWKTDTQKGEKVSQASDKVHMSPAMGRSMTCTWGIDRPLVLMEHKEGIGIYNSDAFKIIAQSQILAR